MKYKYCWKGTCNTSQTDSPPNELQRQRALCPVDCQHVFCSLTNFLTDFSEIISILVFSTLTLTYSFLDWSQWYHLIYDILRVDWFYSFLAWSQWDHLISDIIRIDWSYSFLDWSQWDRLNFFKIGNKNAVVLLSQKCLSE